MLNRSIPNKYKPAIDRSKRLFLNALSRSTNPLEEEIIESELKNIGVESIEQYMKLMDHEGPVEPWLDIVLDKFDCKDSDSSDCLKFFCLGRFHEIAMSYKNEIKMKNLKRAPPPVSETSAVLERERKKARDRDIGSSGSSFIDPSDLSRHIERSGPYTSKNTPPERRRSIIPEIPVEDLIKKSDLSSKAVSCLSARTRLFDIALNLREHSGFMEAAENAGLPIEAVRRHLWNAASATVRSEKTIHSYCNRIEDFINFLKEREIDSKLWSGDESIFFIAEFIKMHDNRSTVPAFIKACLLFFQKVLKINWNLSHPLISAAAKISRKHPIKQAPAFESWQIKELEKIASDRKHPWGMMVIASAICLMTHASLRWNDTLSVSDLSLSDGIIKGRILQPKTSANPQDFNCHEKGFKTIDWSHAIFIFRDEYLAKKGEYPKFLFPAVDKNWNLFDSVAAKRQIEARLRELVHKVGGPPGVFPESYTLHSPRNFYTNASAQLGWSQETQTVLGRWSKKSAMPDHYNRSTGVLELQVRKDISDRIGQGWEPAKSFSLSQAPAPVSSHYGRQDTSLVNQLD